jgi:hypothetical protein
MIQRARLTSTIGKYFVAVVRNRDKLIGKQIAAAADYYTPARLMEEFRATSGKKGEYIQVPHDTYKSFLPPPIAQEILENEILCEDPGFFGGKSLDEGHALLAEVGLAPTTWKDFVASKKALFQ